MVCIFHSWEAVGRIGGKRWEGTHRPGRIDTRKKKKQPGRILWYMDEPFARERLRTGQEIMEDTRKDIVERASQNWQPGKGRRWSTQRIEDSTSLYKRIMTLGTPPENHGSAYLFPGRYNRWVAHNLLREEKRSGTSPAIHISGMKRNEGRVLLIYGSGGSCV